MPASSPRFLADSEERGRHPRPDLRLLLSFLTVGGWVLLTIGPSSVRAQTVTNLAVGTDPTAIAANPVTNKIYVANYSGNSVTVIDGVTNATTNVAVGIKPSAIAVNLVTNKIYTANSGSNTVTVIDGATNASTTAAAVGMGPSAIAVNPLTNKIYVANQAIVENPSTVTVIDGVTSATATVAVGSDPSAIAVNPVTNKIYVTNTQSNTVTVIDGATNATSTVAVGSYPLPLAVNTETNKIYVGNTNSNNVTVIDGATQATTLVTVMYGASPLPTAMAVNPVTNKIYVVDTYPFDSLGHTDYLTVIDGATNASTNVALGPGPGTLAVAVNTVTNTIYVSNDSGTGLIVIAGATNGVSTLSIAGSQANALVVNPLTNKIYANGPSNNVTVIDGGSAGSSAAAARLTNLSIRAQVGTGGNILIPGFVVGGTGTETLLIRGAGPSLSQFGVSGVLAQPSLSLFNSAGTLIASNTGWGTNVNPAQIASVAAQVGAFPFASGSADCSLEVSLPAGAYTVQVSGVGTTAGVALAEVYEVASSGTRLANISGRAQVGTGGGSLIAGFVIAGGGPEKLLARADGPALAQFGVSGVLAQPSLSLFDATGTLTASNLGWATNPDPGLVAGLAKAVGAFPFQSGSSGITSSDSAQWALLPPGAYTLQIASANATTGSALAEVYEVP